MKALNILLAEDNEHDVFFIKKAFAKAAIKIALTVVEDGQGVLDHLKSDLKLPELLIIDLNMPVVDGFDLIKILKQTESYKQLPVIVLTSSEAEEDILFAYKNHVNAYIKKPVTYTKLQEIVKSIENFWFKIVELPPEQ